MARNKRNARRKVVMLCLVVLLIVDVVLAVRLMGKNAGNSQDGGGQGDAGDARPDGSGNTDGTQGDAGSARPDGGGNADGTQGSAGDARPDGSGNTDGTQGDAGSARPDGSGNADGAQGNAGSAKPDGSKDGENAGSNQGSGNSGNTAGDGNNQADGNTGNTATTQHAADLLASLTLEEKVAQMFMITPEALTGYGKVTAAGEATKESFRQYPVGGIIYMGSNLIDPKQTRTMLSNMADYSMELIGLPIFLGVDEEGGTVARVAKNDAFGIKNIGNMSEIGASGDTDKAYEAGKTLGGYLADLGFNLDFAPVADVWSNPKNTVVKYRSFGSDALLVQDMVTAQIKGFKEQGILSVVKHFPGHGSTAADSHKGAAVEKTLQELRECDLIPFAGAVKEGVPFVMVGHLSLPQVVGGDVPAILSEEIIGGILREELGFEGVVITDALDMDAVTDYYSSAEAAVMAIEAGADMLLMPEDFAAAYQGVLDAISEGRLKEERIDASVMRILRVKVEMGE